MKKALFEMDERKREKILSREAEVAWMRDKIQRLRYEMPGLSESVYKKLAKRAFLREMVRW